MRADGHRPQIDANNEFVGFEFFLGGMMLIIYFGAPIAIIGEDGHILMRDPNYPLFLVEYLIQNYEMHKFWLN